MYNINRSRFEVEKRQRKKKRAGGQAREEEGEETKPSDEY
jgi:hypothetical protein